MIHNTLKKLKKSIRFGSGNRIDIFIIIGLFIIVITPIIIHLSFRIEAAAKQVNLYLSAQMEELFGKKKIDSLLREFEERNPGIKIRFGSGEADILFFDDGEFNALIDTNSLLELNSYTNYDSGGRQMAIPLVSFMDMLFYNIDILAAAGFGSPPKTRDEFLNYARTVSRGEFNAFGTALSLSFQDKHALSRDIFSWIWAGGGSLFTADGNRPSLNTRAIINDITFIGTLYRDEIIAPGIFDTTGVQRIDQFAQGNVALMIASARAIPYLRQRMGDSAFGISTVPDLGGGARSSVNLSALYVGINTKTSYPDEAWRFLEFLAEKSSFLCEELNAIPGVVSDIIPGDYVRDDPFYSKAWDIFESVLIAESFCGRPNAIQYESIFLEELKIFFETGRTAQDTVNAVQRRWDAIESP